MVDAHDTPLGKEYNADAGSKPVAANGHPTDGSETAPKDPEQKEDHAEADENMVPSLDQHSTTGHDRMTDTHKDVIDDHGEEVVEAAEDTVIY